MPVTSSDVARLETCIPGAPNRQEAVTPNVVRVIGVDSGDVLLSRKPGPGRGWELGISGWVEPGERTAETAARREVIEELGVQATSLFPLCRYFVPHRGLVIDSFVAHLSSPVLHVARDELAAAEWVPIHEALNNRLADPQHLALLRAIAHRLGSDRRRGKGGRTQVIGSCSRRAS
jgi:8-oxo-dGTP pyrophosphatase MutT (NUDIX family)